MKASAPSIHPPEIAEHDKSLAGALPFGDPIGERLALPRQRAAGRAVGGVERPVAAAALQMDGQDAHRADADVGTDAELEGTPIGVEGREIGMSLKCQRAADREAGALQQFLLREHHDIVGVGKDPGGHIGSVNALQRHHVRPQRRGVPGEAGQIAGTLGLHVVR